MRLVYVPEDRFLSIDGIDTPNIPILSDLPTNLHALQIYEDGLIEPEWLEPISGNEKLPAGFIGRLVNIHNIYTEDKVYLFEVNGELVISYYRGNVPHGIPFISVNPEEIPDAPVGAWEVDFSEPDGIGGQI